jgi:hypothetical protein
VEIYYFYFASLISCVWLIVAIQIKFCFLSSFYKGIFQVYCFVEMQWKQATHVLLMYWQTFNFAMIYMIEIVGRFCWFVQRWLWQMMVITESQDGSQSGVNINRLKTFIFPEWYRILLGRFVSINSIRQSLYKKNIKRWFKDWCEHKQIEDYYLPRMIQDITGQVCIYW